MYKKYGLTFVLSRIHWEKSEPNFCTQLLFPISIDFSGDFSVNEYALVRSTILDIFCNSNLHIHIYIFSIYLHGLFENVE